MTRSARALGTFAGIATLIPVAILLWYESSAAGPFDLYPRLAAAYRAIGLDMAQIQRNQLNHLIAACLAETELWWTLVYAAAPALAAAVAALVLAGKEGLSDLASRYNPLRGLSAGSAVRVYGLTLVVCAAFVAAQVLVALGLGLKLKAPALGAGYALSTFAIGLVFNQGGLLEEGGWRGFLQPFLQNAWRRPIAAAVVVGLIWAAWHLPRDLLKGTPFKDPGAYSVEFAEFALYCVTTAIIHAWLVTTARGSLWPSIAFHGTGNTAEWFMSQLAPGAGATQGFLIENIPALIGAGLVIAFWRPTAEALDSLALPAPHDPLAEIPAVAR